MKKWIVVVLVVLGVLVAGGFGLRAYYTRPVVGAEYEAPVSSEQRAQNSAILSVLASAGIADAFADATPERVYVAYEVPDGVDIDDTEALDALQQRVLGTAAGGAGNAPSAVIVQYFNGAAKTMWKADLTRYDEVREGKLSVEDYLATIEKVSY